MAETSVSAGYVQAALELAVAKGANLAALMAAVGLQSMQFDKPDERVPFTVFKALIQSAKTHCNDPAFGLHFGEESRFSEISIVGLVCQSSETMGAAFHQMNRYAKLAIHVDAPLGANRFELKRIGDDLWLEDQRSDPNDFPELTESTFARFICETARHFGDAPFARSVHFSHKEPSYRAEYERIMRVPLTFASDRNAICIHESWLSIPTHMHNKYVFGIFSERADALLATLEKSATLTGRVESLMMPIIHTGTLGMVQIAAKLGMSRVSLYRRLKAEGTTFADILDGLRHKLALSYLSGGKASVNEVAYLVGFTDPATFSRAFKRWTGKSPSAMK